MQKQYDEYNFSLKCSITFQLFVHNVMLLVLDLMYMTITQELLLMNYC